MASPSSELSTAAAHQAGDVLPHVHTQNFIADAAAPQFPLADATAARTIPIDTTDVPLSAAEDADSGAAERGVPRAAKDALLEWLCAPSHTHSDDDDAHTDNSGTPPHSHTHAGERPHPRGSLPLERHRVEAPVPHADGAFGTTRSVHAGVRHLHHTRLATARQWTNILDSIARDRVCVCGDGLLDAALEQMLCEAEEEDAAEGLATAAVDSDDDPEGVWGRAWPHAQSLRLVAEVEAFLYALQQRGSKVRVLFQRAWDLPLTAALHSDDTPPGTLETVRRLLRLVLRLHLLTHTNIEVDDHEFLRIMLPTPAAAGRAGSGVLHGIRVRGPEEARCGALGAVEHVWHPSMQAYLRTVLPSGAIMFIPGRGSLLDSARWARMSGSNAQCATTISLLHAAQTDAFLRLHDVSVVLRSRSTPWEWSTGAIHAFILWSSFPGGEPEHVHATAETHGRALGIAESCCCEAAPAVGEEVAHAIEQWEQHGHTRHAALKSSATTVHAAVVACGLQRRQGFVEGMDAPLVLPLLLHSIVAQSLELQHRALILPRRMVDALSPFWLNRSGASLARVHDVLRFLAASASIAPEAPVYGTVTAARTLRFLGDVAQTLDGRLLIAIMALPPRSLDAVPGWAHAANWLTEFTGTALPAGVDGIVPPHLFNDSREAAAVARNRYAAEVQRVQLDVIAPDNAFVRMWLTDAETGLIRSSSNEPDASNGAAPFDETDNAIAAGPPAVPAEATRTGDTVLDSWEDAVEEVPESWEAAADAMNDVHPPSSCAPDDDDTLSMVASEAASAAAAGPVFYDNAHWHSGAPLEDGLRLVDAAQSLGDAAALDARVQSRAKHDTSIEERAAKLYPTDVWKRKAMIKNFRRHEARQSRQFELTKASLTGGPVVPQIVREHARPPVATPARPRAGRDVIGTAGAASGSVATASSTRTRSTATAGRRPTPTLAQVQDFILRARSKPSPEQVLDELYAYAAQMLVPPFAAHLLVDEAAAREARRCDLSVVVALLGTLLQTWRRAYVDLQETMRTGAHAAQLARLQQIERSAAARLQVWTERMLRCFLPALFPDRDLLRVPAWPWRDTTVESAILPAAVLRDRAAADRDRASASFDDAEDTVKRLNRAHVRRDEPVAAKAARDAVAAARDALSQAEGQLDRATAELQATEAAILAGERDDVKVSPSRVMRAWTPDRAIDECREDPTANLLLGKNEMTIGDRQCVPVFFAANILQELHIDAALLARLVGLIDAWLPSSSAYWSSVDLPQDARAFLALRHHRSAHAIGAASDTFRAAAASSSAPSLPAACHLRAPVDASRFQLESMGMYFPRPEGAGSDHRVPFRPDVWQRRLLDVVDAGKSALIQAPTSAGKTFIAYYDAKKLLEAPTNGRGIIVIVAPNKSLVNEVQYEVEARYQKVFEGPLSGYVTVGQFTRDYRIDEKRCQVLVTIPQCLEILLLCAIQDGWAARVQRVVFDEVHNMFSSDGEVWERLLMQVHCPLLAMTGSLSDAAADSMHAWLQRLEAVRRPEASDVQRIVVRHRYNDLAPFLWIPPGAPATTRTPTHESRIRAPAAATSCPPPMQRGVKLHLTRVRKSTSGSVMLTRVAVLDAAWATLHEMGADSQPPGVSCSEDTRGDSATPHGSTGHSDCDAPDKAGTSGQVTAVSAARLQVAAPSSLCPLNPVIVLDNDALRPGGTVPDVQLLPEDALQLFDALHTTVRYAMSETLDRGEGRDAARHTRLELVEKALQDLEPARRFAGGTRITHIQAHEYSADLLRVLQQLGGIGDGTMAEAVVDSFKHAVSAALEHADGERSVQAQPSFLRKYVASLVGDLAGEGRLPAIVFHMSQRGCESLARALGDSLLKEYVMAQQERWPDKARRIAAETKLMVELRRAEDQLKRVESDAKRAKATVDDLSSHSEISARIQQLNNDLAEIRGDVSPLDLSDSRFTLRVPGTTKSMISWEEIAERSGHSVYKLRDLVEEERRKWAAVAAGAHRLERVSDCGPSGLPWMGMWDLLRHGIGIHHAALDTRYRSAVEILYRERRVPVLFATATLAQGINMPCKTVVIAGDSVYLTSMNFRQMAGRAGRRGKDLRGNVVFFGVPHRRALQLMGGALPGATPAWPIGTSQLLRLMVKAAHDFDVKAMVQSRSSDHLLHAEAARAREAFKRALPRMLHMTFLSQLNPSGVDKTKVHVRFALELLRKMRVLDSRCVPVDLAAIISHLHFTAPANFMVIHLLLGDALQEVVQTVHRAVRNSDLTDLPFCNGGAAASCLQNVPLHERAMDNALLTVLAFLFERIPHFEGAEWRPRGQSTAAANGRIAFGFHDLPEVIQSSLSGYDGWVRGLLRMYLHAYVLEATGVVAPSTLLGMGRIAPLPHAGTLPLSKMVFPFSEMTGHLHPASSASAATSRRDARTASDTVDAVPADENALNLLRELAAPPLLTSPFAALGGGSAVAAHASSSDVATLQMRPGCEVDPSLVPSFGQLDLQLNSYMLDFYAHGQRRLIAEENRLDPDELFDHSRNFVLAVRALATAVARRAVAAGFVHGSTTLTSASQSIDDEFDEEDDALDADDATVPTVTEGFGCSTVEIALPGARATRTTADGTPLQEIPADHRAAAPRVPVATKPGDDTFDCFSAAFLDAAATTDQRLGKRNSEDRATRERDLAVALVKLAHRLQVLRKELGR